MTDGNGSDDSDTDVFEGAGLVKSKGGDSRWVELPTAAMLTLQEADELLRWRDASVVAIVGERKGGKTTLVAELYERFLRGAFAETSFSHSLSLHGFELKTFQSRAESGGDTPDTQRTSTRDGLKFFHLAVSDNNSCRNDLLISERAGEKYRDVRDRPLEASDLVEVRKARTVVFILDGERVADPLRRSEAMASVRLLARALTSVNAIAPHCELQVVTTKWDLLNVDTMTDARELLSSFEQKFVDTYKSRFANVSTFHVAARDPKGRVEVGLGLAPLLQSWLAPLPNLTPHIPALPELADEFDRLLVRRLN